MSDSLKFAFEFGKTPASRPRDPDRPMRILVLGNFGGREPLAAAAGLAQRKIQRVDVDNFENLLAKVRPVVRVPLSDSSDAVVEIEFRELDDFHPDRLYRDLPVFQQLRDLRKRLLDIVTFPEAAAQLRQAIPEATAATQCEPSVQSETPAKGESDADTLGRILGGSAAMTQEAGKRPSQVDVSSLINAIVAPHIVPGPDPRQDEYIHSLDAAVSAQMRAILHDDAFQSLEAIWRSLHFLITTVETSEELQIFLWDATEAELRQAVGTESGRLEDSVLFDRLVTQREEDPWSVLVSAESFAGDEHDLSLLGTLGAVAAHAGAALLASAAPELLGCASWSDQVGLVDAESDDLNSWASLRSSPVAPWIGLVAPRLLLRLPYGTATDPIDAFALEEIDDPITDHESFLWGSPAIASATLIATSFVDSGWAMTPGDHLELGDLPAAAFAVDGESQLKPCAEIFLPERLADSILAHGVMPLMSYKNRNAVRMLRFQSIAASPGPLQGPWS